MEEMKHRGENWVKYHIQKIRKPGVQVFADSGLLYERCITRFLLEHPGLKREDITDLVVSCEEIFPRVYDYEIIVAYLKGKKEEQI